MKMCMKRIIICFLCMLMIGNLNSSQAKAYTVSVEEEGIYEDVIPKYITQNVAKLFEKQVKKAMQYEKKYGKAGDYVYMTKVPDAYRDFIAVAKKVKALDQIKICHPFYIYSVDNEENWYSYYFEAKQNGKKLCLFSIDVDVDNGKTVFSYDKMLDQYVTFGDNITEKTIFYKMNDIVYAENSKEVRVLRDQSSTAEKMIGDNKESEKSTFAQKSYDQKKKEIFSYLDAVKKGKAVKKSEENVKKTLHTAHSESTGEKDNTKVETQFPWRYLAVAGGIVVCIVVGVEIVLKRKIKN